MGRLSTVWQRGRLSSTNKDGLLTHTGTGVWLDDLERRREQQLGGGRGVEGGVLRTFPPRRLAARSQSSPLQSQTSTAANRIRGRISWVEFTTEL